MKKIFLILILLQGSLLWAQSNLELHVISLGDQSPRSGITVFLTNKAIGFSAQKATDEQGKVLFSGLPVSGQYAASVSESDDFYPGLAEGIELRSNTTASVNIGLAPRKDFEVDAVLITSGAAIKSINTVNAEVSSTLSRQESTELPVEGRDITRLLFRLPNVTQATGFYPEAPNVAINGANALFTNYLIDGMDNNERFLGGQKFAMPIGFMQSVSVLSNKFSAEFGNTANGVINLTTRSGSNTTHAEAFAITRPGPAIDGKSPYPQRDLSGNQVLNGFQRYQAGFALGGALVKNKTFYFLNAEQTIDLKDNVLSSPVLGVNETVRGTNRFTYLSGKIDQQWSSRFRSSLRINSGIVNIERQGGGLEGGVSFPSAGNRQDRNSFLSALKNTYTGDRFLSETNVQFARFHWNYSQAVNPNSPQVAVLDPDGQTIAVLGHPGYEFNSFENTLQGQQKFTFFLGKHTLKTGAEIISADHQLIGGGNANGNYTVQLTADQLATVRALNRGASLNVNDIPANVQVLNYNVELRPASYGTRQNIFSLYAEDQWAVTTHLNVTLGLRYDYDNLSKGGSDKGDVNNLAPRTSFNYRLSSRSSIRGGYGLYYDKVLYAIYSDALQQNTTSPDYLTQLQALKDQGILPANTDLNAITYDGNLSANASGVPYLNGPSASSLQEQRNQVFSGERRILNPNGYQNPYNNQFSLGYQYQASENMLFYVDVMHNRSENLFRLRNLNGAAPYPITDPNNVVVRTQAEADLSRPVPIYGNYALINGDTVRGVARNIVVTESGGSSRYTAMSLNLQKARGNDDYSYRIIYTLSELRNNTEDINFRAANGNDFEAEWGPSINDRTHVLNGIFSWYPVSGLTATVASLLQSGQPINRIPTGYGTTDLNGDGQSFGDAYVGNSDRYPGESRNSDRLPWASTFDLGAQYDFKVGDGKLSLRADVFNLFNAANLSGYSNNATQSNQIQPGAAASGVLIRRNAAPPRQFQFGLYYSI